MENTQDPKNLVLVQQSGIVITSIATLVIAGVKIYKTVKDGSASVTPSE